VDIKEEDQRLIVERRRVDDAHEGVGCRPSMCTEEDAEQRTQRRRMSTDGTRGGGGQPTHREKEEDELRDGDDGGDDGLQQLDSWRRRRAAGTVSCFRVWSRGPGHGSNLLLRVLAPVLVKTA
jgi:hypothetical protein